VKGRA
jgi:hypothetical protein